MDRGKELRVVIKDRRSVSILTPDSMLRDGTLAMDDLREQTIRAFAGLLARGMLTQRDEVVVLGTHLYQGLFDEHLSDCFKEAYDDVKKVSGQLRMVLEFRPDAQSLAAMPWEYLYAPDTSDDRGFFLASNPRLVLIRQVGQKLEVVPAAIPLRILVVVSKPEKDTDGSVLNTVKEREILDTIENVKETASEKIETSKLTEPTRRSLSDRMAEFKPHIVHFIGHGKFGEIGYLALVQERDVKSADWISDSDLADCIGSPPQLQLIFLHACEGAHRDAYRCFRGVAFTLARNRVPAVVAMQFEVENLVGTMFAKEFYQALGRGSAIDVAVQEGRRALRMYLDEHEFSSRAFGCPVAYLRPGVIGGIVDDQITRAGQAPVSASKVTCAYGNCQALVTPGDNFCGGCERPLLVCKKCESVVVPDRICRKCGLRAPDRKEASPGAVPVETARPAGDAAQIDPDVLSGGLK